MPQYDFKQVTVSIGNQIITGFGEGDDVINVVRDEDGVALVSGAKGYVTTSKIANPIGTISLSLQSQSPSNTLLTKLARNKSAFSINIIENNTQKMQAGGSTAYVLKEADNPRGKSSGERSWEIKVENLEMNE